ncbi:unnamed protein product, partial [Vitis vinifera]|uniref:Uncharacterized protein n=1 Tax=Vitis vinifera TaxID=29760 RepID=D7TD58_VITVI
MTPFVLGSQGGWDMTSKIVAANVEQMKPLEAPNGGWNVSFEIVV